MLKHSMHTFTADQAYEIRVLSSNTLPSRFLKIISRVEILVSYRGTIIITSSPLYTYYTYLFRERIYYKKRFSNSQARFSFFRNVPVVPPVVPVSTKLLLHVLGTTGLWYHAYVFVYIQYVFIATLYKKLPKKRKGYHNRVRYTTTTTWYN